MKTTVLLLLLAAPHFSRAEDAKIQWQDWSDDLFKKAQAEKRFVLLDLGAAWCHWCHVMDKTTYEDAEVVKLMREKYIAVHVDQDARPDLANRYEDYGWPATIVFAPDGSEIVKRRGYLPPRQMAALLQAIIEDPTPGPFVEPEKKLVVGTAGALTESQRASVRKLLEEQYDEKKAGWGDAQKFLNWDVLEYCLTTAEMGDRKAEKMAKETLAAGQKLIDPVWGGIYQYSTDGDWDHAHFEKIMPFQAESLRIFSQAYALWQDPKHLKAAQSIRAYLKKFLTAPEGAFYVSQDADVVQGEHSGEYFALDDAGRRKQGVPRIDKHLYARENGLAIMGLCSLYAVSNEEEVIKDAVAAANWVAAHRALAGGGFSHDAKDAGGPYLADTLCMARAFTQLHAVTGERVWLQRASEALKFIDQRFHGTAGFSTAAVAAAGLPPKAQFDENVFVGRLANLVHHYTGEAAFRQMAEHAMRYLATPEVLGSRGYGSVSVLLADAELRGEPQHITVAGAKKSAKAAALFAVARGSARAFKRVEWWDEKEGPLPHMETSFPSLPQPAAFLCADGACSAPIVDASALTRRLRPEKAK